MWSIYPNGKTHKSSWGCFIVCCLLLSFLCSDISLGAESVRVGIYDFKPLVYRNDNGEPAGIYVDILEEIARRENWEVSYVYGTWPEGLQRLEKGELDILTGILRSEKREKIFSFSSVSVLSTWGQLYVRSGDKLQNFQDLEGKRIAVVKGGYFYPQLKHRLQTFDINANFVMVEKYEEVFELLHEGEVDACSSERVTGFRAEAEYDIQKTPLIYNRKEFLFAAPQGRTKILGAIDEHLKQLKKQDGSVYAESLQRHLHRTGFAGVVPRWLIWTLGGVIGICLLTFATIYYLRRIVRRRTKELQEKKTLLSRSQSIGRVGSWVYEIDKDNLEWSEQTYRIFGLDPEENSPTFESFLEGVHPEDRERVKKGYWDSVENGSEGYEIEHRIVRTDNDETRYVREKSENEFDDDGHVIRSFGMVQDVTEQTLADKEINRLNSLLKTTREVNRTIAGSNDPERLLQQSCDILLDSINYEDVWAVAFGEAEGVRYTGHTGDVQFENLLSRMESGYTPECVRRALEKPGDPIVMFPEKDCCDCPLQDLHTDSRSLKCGFPENTNINGLLSFYCPAGHNPSTEEKHLIAEVASDIAHGLQRIEAEKELEQSEERYRRLFETAQDGMLILDTETEKIIDANPFIKNILNYSRDELIGKKLWEVGPLRHVVENKERFEDLVSRGYVRYEDLPMETKDGEEVAVEFVSNTYMAGDTQVVQCNIRDITARKQAEEDLREAQEQMIEQERRDILTQMASGIAHDFNNALATIKGFTDLLLRSEEKLNDREMLLQYLKRVRKAASNASETVQRMRKFYRPSEEGNYETMDINGLLEEALSLTEPRWREEAQAAGAEINVEKDLGDIPPVEGDEAEIHELFTNLIFNAVDAMPAGGELSFRTYKTDGKVIIEIGDTGTGMDEETREKCFDPFYTTKQETGTGLGLSTAQGIVQRHDGDISVESKKGEGTTFRIVLPRQQDRPEDAMSDDETGNTRTGLRILLAEDDAGQRRLIEEYLQMDNHEVHVVADGREGLSALEEGNYDLIITDRSMPEMSGDEMAREMKNEFPEKPVIMLTGFGDMMDASGETPDNVDMVVSKPLSMEKLREVIARVMGGE